MPFINDQLDHNNEQLERRKYEQKAARVSRFKFCPEQVIADLHERIVGQTTVLDAMKDMLFTLKADFGVKHRPLSLILLMGPTGVGKTEISRRLAKLAGAPFVKVEASKFTEVGYVGRDVESMIRDLTELAVNMAKQEEQEKVKRKAIEIAEEKV